MCIKKPVIFQTTNTCLFFKLTQMQAGNEPYFSWTSWSECTYSCALANDVLHGFQSFVLRWQSFLWQAGNLLHFKDCTKYIFFIILNSFYRASIFTLKPRQWLHCGDQMTRLHQKRWLPRCQYQNKKNFNPHGKFIPRHQTSFT